MGRRKINTPEILKKYKADYYQRNKERLNQKSKEWAAKNREKSRAIKKRYQDKNPDKQKLWKESQPKEKFLEYQKRYSEKYPERIRASKNNWLIKNPKYMSQYLEKNSEKFRAASLRRRASKKSNSTAEQILSADIKIKRMIKNKFVLCPYCEFVFNSSEMHVDHIFPLSRGGFHSAENVTLACAKCNLSKADKILYSEWIPPFMKYATQN